jgi:hypothetical protein
MNWIDLAQNRDISQAVMIAVMNLLVPQNAGNCLTNLGSCSLKGRTLFHVAN